LIRNALTNSSASNHPFRGYLSIAAATLCWGAAATLGKAVFTGRLLAGSQALRPIDPLILTQTRVSFALLILAPLVLARGGRAALSLPPRDVVRCMVLAVLGVAGSNYFYFYAIAKTTVATAIILQYTAPVWVLLYLVARRRQRATATRVIAVTAAVAGSALVVGGHLRANPAGVAAGLGAAFSFAFYNLYGHSLLARYDRWRVLVYTLLGATVFWLLVNPPWKLVAARYSGREWGFLLVFSVLSVLLPFSFYFAGLQYLDATRAIVTSCLEPVFAMVLAAAFVGESLHPLQGVGIAVVLIATVLVQLQARRGGERPTGVSVSVVE
jgi:drug/metabolite transporter (DMT)-like permease